MVRLGTPERHGATWFATRRLFVRGLGVVYGVAFLSLWVQIEGLFGSAGIAPVSELLEWVRERDGGANWLRVPTLLWWSASDWMLHALCAFGVLGAVLTVFGLAPRWMLFVCWASYLSLCSVGEPFLSFQWDVLLLETGFLGLAFAPGGLRPFRGEERPVALVPHWLLRWLLFRLMFLSGMLKLLSGDTSWHDGSALVHHYWTQPLPHRIAHFTHHLPDWFHGISVWVMFAIEIAVAFLALGPRRLREACAAATLLLMVAIAGTGNYGFFNLLTVLLCVPLVDDRTWRVLLRRGDPPEPAVSKTRLLFLRRTLAASFGAAVLVFTTIPFLLSLGVIERPPSPLADACASTRPFRSFNSYGLFRVMTKERPEIVVEGSADGVTWTPYVFHWKPGDPTRPPGFTGPHMPRLDWQMWFAGLAWQSRGRPRWYESFLTRLLRGSPAVRGLLSSGPFREEPPRYLRSRLFLYRFSSPAERGDGTWWVREDRGTYFPTVELIDGELAVARLRTR